ncbi:hypothetical protein Tco_0326763 [Tanacetum coccineum]
MASPNCVRMASGSFVDDEGCCNANVVVNSDLGGAAWHHACNFAVFDAALSIPAAASMLSWWHGSMECLQPQVEEDMTQERMSEIGMRAINAYGEW